MSGVGLTHIIGAGPLLLDFDGPVCSVFAGEPAPRVAKELVTLLDFRRMAIPPEIRGEEDPLAVLRWTAETCPVEVVGAIEDAMCAAELRAVRTAAPTPSSREVIVGANSRGIPLAVVSNNSEPAIRAYLAAHGLTGHIGPIVGRPHAEPARMKPNPWAVVTAVDALRADPRSCTLVGDSLTDIEAARAAGVNIIGYANRPWKTGAFAGADAVVTSMGDIAAALSSA
ncbi:HAD-IA family hydrolase [Actinoplanes sp. NPDC026623]|uniref:HAD family hydrolase n=1 Tax=Actinoplanes sp. NPDC026623 TaxID=3155610 RepID=UPI0033C8F0D0